MAKYQSYNANPIHKRTGDCTVRAISTILGKPWDEIYWELCIQGALMHDMPSSNATWGAYLKSKGFTRYRFTDEIPENYTIIDFCDDNPQGKFLLGTGTHVVAVVDGCYIDSWDSGEEIPVYVFKKEE